MLTDDEIKTLFALASEDGQRPLWSVAPKFARAVESAVLERLVPVAWRSKELVNKEFVTDWVLTQNEPPTGIRTVAIEPLYAKPRDIDSEVK